jgi:DNA polymerase III sliding clamp (beta) subunit (PCNA family)
MKTYTNVKDLGNLQDAVKEALEIKKNRYGYKQIGENKTTIPAKTQGDGGEIAFNARFLSDLLNVFPEEEVVFEMNGNLAPGVFHPLKPEVTNVIRRLKQEFDPKGVFNPGRLVAGI